jgi:Asp-tRNA(Asn)/Glu-tRNA(Gln) amidotransferase A subunit family amidase
MVAGEPHQGALKHKDVVLRYEIRTAMAQHALMRSFYHEHYDEIVARGSELAVEVHLYRGDATNQDAVQRMPVQTSELASVLVSSEALHGWAEGTTALQLPYKRTLGALQILSEKTGENLRALILRQLRSVGWPAWVHRAQRVRRLYVERVDVLFADHDVLLAPAVPVVAPTIGCDWIEIRGRRFPSRPSMGLLTQPVSCAGLPGMAAPPLPAI